MRPQRYAQNAEPNAVMQKLFGSMALTSSWRGLGSSWVKELQKPLNEHEMNNMISLLLLISLNLWCILRFVPHSLHCYYTRPVSLAAKACSLSKKFCAIETQGDNATILWLQVQLFQTCCDLYFTFLIGRWSWSFGIIETDVSCTILSMKPKTHHSKTFLIIKNSPSLLLHFNHACGH